TELPNALAVAAAQDVDDVAGAEPLAGPIDAGEQLLCHLRPIEHLRRFDTGVAVTARLAGIAEIGEQHLAAALHRLAEAEERIELLPLQPLLRVRCGGAFDQLPDADHVCEAIDHPRIGREAVAAGPPGLLVIRLEALRQVEM